MSFFVGGGGGGGRKRGRYTEESESFPTIYGLDHLESTLQVETGGESTLQVGAEKTIPISSGILGCELFQYNQYFWSKNHYTFTHANCLMGLVFAYHRQGKTYTAIFPLAMPRGSSSLTGGVTHLPDSIPNAFYAPQNAPRILVGEWVYALESAFGFSSPVLAQDFLFPAVPINHPAWPLFQTATLPPLRWNLLNDGLQTDLTFETSYVLPQIPPEHMAFQLMSIEPFMVPNDTTTGGIAAIPSFQTFTMGVNKGWVGQGPYATGFGQYYQSAPIARYYDGYTSDERRALWALTSHPVSGAGITQTTAAFIQFCQQFRLNIANAISGSTTCTVSGLNTSLIPSRYLVTQSSVLSVNQKRPCMSNSPSLQSAENVAVLFLTIDGLQANQDATASAGGTNQSESAPILALRKYEAKNILDLTIVDEWGNVLMSYPSLGLMNGGPGNLYNNSLTSGGILGSLPVQADLILDHNDGLFGISGGLFRTDGAPEVAAPYLALNPLPAQNPNGQCSYIIRKMATMALIFLLRNILVNGQSVKIPNNFSGSGPNAMGVIHFGRIINDFHL